MMQKWHLCFKDDFFLVPVQPNHYTLTFLPQYPPSRTSYFFVFDSQCCSVMTSVTQVSDVAPRPLVQILFFPDLESLATSVAIF